MVLGKDFPEIVVFHKLQNDGDFLIETWLKWKKARKINEIIFWFIIEAEIGKKISRQ